MQFKIDKQIFSNGLTMINPYLEKRDLSSVVANVLIKIKDSVLTLYATDYEYGLKLTITDIYEFTDCEFLVNGSDLLNIVKRLKSGEISLNVDGDVLTVKQGRSKLRLQTLPIEEYPTLMTRKESMNELNIDNQVLSNGIKNCIYSIDSGHPKVELQNLLLNIKDSITFVSTNAVFLTMVESDIKTKFDNELLISKKSVNEIQKLTALNDFKIYFDDVHLIIESELFMFFTKLSNGKFINYKQVVPTDFKINIDIPKYEFIQSIKMVTAMDSEVLISIEKNKFIFEAGEGKNKSDTDIEFEFDIVEPVSFMCNADKLIESINNITGEVFTLRINDNELPILIESGNYKVITMPIKKLKN